MPVYEEMGLPRRNRLVLIVEDNEISRDILHSIIEDDFDVIEAANGQEGIELMQGHHDELSLILLDVFMPVLDGFEFLRFRQSDERYANIPVIVATASDTLEDEIACLQLGANDVVRKPYNADVILNRMKNTIRLRESASVVNQLRWDAVTSLYRREFFCRRVDNLLEAYPDREFDLICSDIRNFKMLNERYGRENCDELLHDLANRLVVSIPGVMASGRVGGDSFGFLIEHTEGSLYGALSAAVDVIEVAHFFVRFGIVQNVDHEVAAQQLCDRAFIAIDEVRDSVGVGICLYDDVLRRRKAMEHTIIESMGQAIADEQFLVYYQPKHNVRTGGVAGAEALVRWKHPELGLLRPDLFVSVLEQHGLITTLDLYVCEQACRQMEHLQELGLPVVPISVNISPLDFDDHSLAEHILQIADRYDIDHSSLHLELTETAYAEDPEVVVDALRKLRIHGFKIELDDFGSGYSSLALLNLLPLDILKIDGSMVRHAAELNDFRIIQSSIQIAQLLGLETVVEGVETSSALTRLRELGCDLIQGFYFSRPLQKDDFEEYLAAY